MARGSVTKRGDSWRARFLDAERRERQRSFARKGLAVAWLNEQMSAVARGEFVDPGAGRITFGDYAAQWLDAQHVREATARLQEQRLRLYINPTVGDVALRSLRRSHVVEVVRRCTHDLGLSPLVTKYAVATFRAVLESAVRDRLIASNVAADRTIAMPKRERQAIVPLTAEQIAAIANAIDPRLRAMVLLAAVTGLRSGELRGLTADRVSPPVHVAALDVAPRQAVLRIDRQLVVGRVLAPPKTDSSVRDVTIGAATVEVLREHVQRFGLGPDGLIFTNAVGTPVDASQLSVSWTRAVAAAGAPSAARVHDLRHHHASTLLSAGISIAAVARRLGHGSPAVTLSTYAHCMPSDDERVLQASEAIAARLA